MNEWNISDEFLSRFLEGTTTEEENEQILRQLGDDPDLISTLASMAEAAKLAGAVPQTPPDKAKAEQQICAELHSKEATVDVIPTLPHRSRTRMFLAVAAVAVVLIGTALFFLFRPDHTDNNFVQQEGKCVEIEAESHNQISETTSEQGETKNTRQNDTLSKKDDKDDHSEMPEPQSKIYSTQKIEKHYAVTQEVNSLNVTKPRKESYRVLCKNLEKTLAFEWSATNVQNLHFVVKNAKGNTIAETKDANSNHFSLKYGDIYPEQKLTWSLIVVFKDGSQDMRSGQVQIDYNN